MLRMGRIQAGSTASHLISDARRPFVGRAREIADLQSALDAATTGQGQVILLVGEAGIGKTRLGETIAAYGRGRGVLVLWGHCVANDGVPDYWPWAQVIRTAMRDLDDEILAVSIRAAGAHLRRMVPELRKYAPARGAATPLDDAADEGHFRAFEAVAAFLKRLATVQPLLIVLDDLHAADRPSLVLLDLLARDLRDDAILILGCHREVEVRQCPELTRTLGNVGRHGRHIPLSGLSVGEVGSYIERSAACTAAARVVTAVHQATDGNPFFVDAMVSSLAADGGPTRPASARSLTRLQIPEAVREVIHSVLPLQVGRDHVIRTAAIIGRTFNLSTLARVVEQPIGSVLASLDDCRDLGIVQEVADLPDCRRFSHALTHQTLYEDILPSRRVQLHLRIGNALEAQCGADRDSHLPELAHHFFMAAPAGNARKAFEYCVAAARRASRMLAFDEATTHYEHALLTLASIDVGEDERCDVLLALGRAQDLAGDVESAKRTFTRAAEVARTSHDPHRLAGVALGIGSRWAMQGLAGAVDESDVDLLQEARNAIGLDDHAVRAQLSSRLALSLDGAGRQDEARALGSEAVALARRLDDPAVLSYVLRARHGALRRPYQLAQRVQTSVDLEAIARATGDRELALRSQAFLAIDMLEAAHIERAEAAMQEHARLAHELREPFDGWLSEVMRAARLQLTGQLEEAAHHSQNALALAPRWARQQAPEEPADVCAMVQTFFERRDHGTLQGFDADALRWTNRCATNSFLRTILVLTFIEVGRLIEARQHFDRLAHDGFANVPWDTRALGCRALLAEAAVALGDHARAALLYDSMASYEDRIAGAMPAVSLGAMARYLGLLAAMLGRWTDAEAHFERALALNARIAARGFLAYTHADFADMLIARNDGADDWPRASSFADAALVTAREIGLVPLAERAANLKQRLVTSSSSTSEPASVPDDRCVFAREGEYWTAVFAGTTVRLHRSKGMVWLAALLRHPGVPLRAVDLAFSSIGNEAEQRSLTSSDAGELLDARACCAYERRVEELSELLAEAESAGDGEATATLRQELGFVATELSRGRGMGKRPRRAASTKERARVSVTRAIRGAMARIDEAHAALGRHLRATVRTGATCAYLPDPRLPVTWRTSTSPSLRDDASQVE